MNLSLLLCCLVLSISCWVTAHTHMIMEEQQNSNQSTISVHVMNETPPVLIVGMSNTPKKNKKSEKKPKKNKHSGRVRRPPPPPNCVPQWGSCRTPSAVCCEPCAFCHCRLLKTVCYCRRGNPSC